MKEPTIDERRRWWLLCYGITAMNKAKQSCDLLAEHCEDWDHPLFEPLALAVHTFYARPFVKSFGVGRLENDIVPDTQHGVHEWLMHFRSGFMAHTDATPDDVAGHPMNDVVYFINGDDWGFSTLYARAPAEKYREASLHCDRMIEVFQSHLFSFYRRFRDLMPTANGEHLLSLDADSPTFRLGHINSYNSEFRYK